MSIAPPSFNFTSAWKNIGSHTIMVYGRQVSPGEIVELGSSKRAQDAAAMSDGLQPVDSIYRQPWTNLEVASLKGALDWWEDNPWVGQQELAKKLQKSVAFSSRTYASIRTKLYRLAEKFNVAYMPADRDFNWKEGSAVRDGRLVRGERIVMGKGRHVTRP